MKYYSMTQFASAVSRTKQTVHYAIQKGRIQAIRIGNQWIICEDQLDIFRKGMIDESVRIYVRKELV